MNPLFTPDSSPIAGSEKVTGWWLEWFSRVNAFVNAGRQSGATANRPAKALWIGRRYYDATLGKPVFVSNVNPTVWVDSSGTVS
ncbi:hypothetical protein [Caenimonas soli]|uniref:hypothetical protein n=1 Tax=Caenimonas soli TaxID=2735555 RepID=UPI0015543A86|nr:hypothetical protein [Caenimonas soli]NPC57849.1 hypothetical protein [Caenimonas soli]